jgi:mono/diheme cytochrome c family protein
LALKGLLVPGSVIGLENEMLRDAVVSGLGGRELEFLGTLIADKAMSVVSSGKKDLMSALTQSILRSGAEDKIQGLFGLVASFVKMGDPNQMVLLDSILALVAPSKGKPLEVLLMNDPAGLMALQFIDEDAVLEKISKILDSIEWGESVVAKLSAKAAAENAPASAVDGPIAMGRTLYAATCGACHQANGAGLAGLAPPLADSEWVTGSEARLARIVLHGLTGPITVNDVTYQMEMPALAVFDDEQIAGVLSYIRQEWGNEAPAVSADTVKQIRTSTGSRTAPWTQDELLQIP